MLVLTSTLTGCAYEIHRPIYAPSCETQRSNCLILCRENNLHNALAHEACNKQCEMNFTSCLQPTPVVVEQESPVVVETDPAVIVDPFPVFGGGWRRHGYWHPGYFHHFRR